MPSADAPASLCRQDIDRRWTGGLHLYFLIWGLLCLLLARERLFGDAAFYLFRVVNAEDFVIFHQRPGSVLTQWLPVLLSKLHAPLKSIILAYSFAEWLWNYLILIVLLHGLRMQGLALAWAFIYTLCNRESFYNPVSEMYHTAPLLLLATGALFRWGLKPLTMLAWCLALAFAGKSHPLNVLMAAWLLGWLCLHFDWWRQWRLWLLGGLSVALALGVMLTLSDYDRSMLQNAPPWGQLLRQIHRVPWGRMLMPYRWMFLLLGAWGLVKIYRHKRLQAGYMVLASVVFLLLLARKFPLDDKWNPEAFERYLYAAMLPWMTVLGLSVGDRLLAHATVGPRLNGMIALLLCVEMGTVLFKARQLVPRFDRLEAILSDLRPLAKQKVVLPREHFWESRMQHDWTMVNETMLLSSAKGPDSVIAFSTIEAIDLAWLQKMPPEECFYASFWGISCKDLNPHYFRFRNQALYWAATPFVPSAYDSSFYAGLRAQVLSHSRSLTGWHTLEFALGNANQKVLASSGNIRLALRTLDAKGHEMNTFAALLWMDLPPQGMRQWFVLKGKDLKNVHALQMGLLLDGHWQAFGTKPIAWPAATER